MKKRWLIAPKLSDDVVTQLLTVRNISKEVRSAFLNPPFPDYGSVVSNISVAGESIDASSELIKKAIKDKRTIVIHGDYDVDGLCATAILWETLYFILGYKDVYPYIPDRFGEGYGLTIDSIENLSAKTGGKKSLLITVDCGITAVEAVEHAKKLGFEVLITDHHTPSEVVPEASVVVQTKDLAGAGISWLLSQKIANIESDPFLELVALATIADMQPLLGANRSLVKYGLEQLSITQRVGLRALMQVANVRGREITPYIAGWWLVPRLNATGRLENAFESLRLLCTRNPARAIDLAKKLNRINLDRQQMTSFSVGQAAEMVDKSKAIQILYHEDWHEGIIGLVAGKIKEEFYRPTVIIAKGEKYSKGSARSVENFNIIEALRECEDCLVDVGGHPMAAGFTIETSQIEIFQQRLLEVAVRNLTEEDLRPAINIDLELGFAELSLALIEDLKKLEPYGIGNPQPTFLSRNLEVLDSRIVGADGSHLRLFLAEDGARYPAIGFGLANLAQNISLGDRIDLVYTLSENEYGGQKEIQINIKDLDKSKI